MKVYPVVVVDSYKNLQSYLIFHGRPELLMQDPQKTLNQFEKKLDRDDINLIQKCLKISDEELERFGLDAILEEREIPKENLWMILVLRNPEWKEKVNRIISEEESTY